MPEPETQPLYTPATDPSQPQDDTPRQLEIDEILDLTTSQSRQGARSQGGKTPQQTITTEKPRPTKPAGQTPKPKPQPRPQQPQRNDEPQKPQQPQQPQRETYSFNNRGQKRNAPDLPDTLPIHNVYCVPPACFLSDRKSVV